MFVPKTITIFLLLSSIFTTNAQSVKIVKLPQLQKVIAEEKADVVVVNFWATWCKPCVTELPFFENIAQKYSKKKVSVLLVSLDALTNSVTKVEPFIKKETIFTPVYILDEKNPNEWIDKIDKDWSGAIPATLIISPKKKKKLFLEQELTQQQLEEYINPLL